MLNSAAGVTLPEADRAAHEHDALGPRLRVGRAAARRWSADQRVPASSRRHARRGSRPHAAPSGCAAAAAGRGRRAGLAVDVRGDERVAQERPSAPAATGMSSRPTKSRTRIAFAVVFSSVWLPATVVTPSSSTSGLARASSSAMASSCPGSQSIRIPMMRSSGWNGSRSRPPRARSGATAGRRAGGRDRARPRRPGAAPRPSRALRGARRRGRR